MTKMSRVEHLLFVIATQKTERNILLLQRTRLESPERVSECRTRFGALLLSPAHELQAPQDKGIVGLAFRLSPNCSWDPEPRLTQSEL